MPNIEGKVVAQKFYDALRQFLQTLDDIYDKRIDLPRETLEALNQEIRTLVNFLRPPLFDRMRDLPKFNTDQTQFLIQKLGIRFWGEKGSPTNLNELIRPDFVPEAQTVNQLTAISQYTERLKSGVQLDLEKLLARQTHAEMIQAYRKEITGLKLMIASMLNSATVNTVKAHINETSTKLNELENTVLQKTLPELKEIIKILDTEKTKSVAFLEKLQKEHAANTRTLAELDKDFEQRNENLESCGLEILSKPAPSPEVDLNQMREKYAASKRQYNGKMLDFSSKKLQEMEGIKEAYLQKLIAISDRMQKFLPEEELKNRQENVEQFKKTLSEKMRLLTLKEPYTKKMVEKYLLLEKEIREHLDGCDTWITKITKKIETIKALGEQHQHAEEQTPYQKTLTFLKEIEAEYTRLHREASDIPDIKTFQGTHADTRIPELAKLYQSFDKIAQNYVGQMKIERHTPEKLKEIINQFDASIKKEISSTIEKPPSHFIGNVKLAALREWILKVLEKCFNQPPGLGFFGTKTTEVVDKAAKKLGDQQQPRLNGG